MMVIWLVVWNMVFIFHFIYMGCHPSHWRSPSFFKMVKTATNQSSTSIHCYWCRNSDILRCFPKGLWWQTRHPMVGEVLTQSQPEYTSRLYVLLLIVPHMRSSNRVNVGWVNVISWFTQSQVRMNQPDWSIRSIPNKSEKKAARKVTPD